MADVKQNLRAIVVGAGGMGQGWLRNVHNYDEVELAGVVDIDVARAKQSLEKLGLPDVPVADDLGAIAAQAEADFVVDVTIPEAHHPVTLQAFELGLPVIGEKPLAATLAEALELAAASEAYGKLFMVSQSRRYNEKLFAFRDQIRGLGRLGILSATFFKAPHFGGFRDAMAHPLVLDMAIHQFDAARFLTDAEPVAVYCEEYNPAWSWYDGDAAASALFEMTGGVRFNFDGSWCSEGLETSWDSEWRASCERGTALWSGDELPTASEPVESSTQPAAGGINGSLREFVGALRTGERPMGEAHDNVMSLAMVHAAIESSLTKQRVRFADILERAHAEAMERTTGAVHDALAAWTSLTPPGK